MHTPSPQVHREIAKQRLSLLATIDRSMQKPVAFLGFVWLVLIIVTFVWGSNIALTFFTWAIWAVFLIDFLIRLIVAPKKIKFLRRNVLTAVSLVLPALGILRIGRLLTLVPSWQIIMLKLVASVNRSMRVLASTMQRRGIAYVALLVTLVTFSGAAGMLAFERGVPGAPMTTFGYALWWTAMTMTTMGSDYYPHTPGGRLLCLLLAIFAFTIFGYVTGSLLSYFVNKDAGEDDSSIPDAKQLQTILEELRGVRAELASLRMQAQRQG